MRFPSFAFAAVAGLWQQPLAPKEETITSTRHIHITRTITNSASTIYAVRMGTATVYMEYLPATMMPKSIPWQALPTTHLELRSEATSTMHIKVTQTVAQIQATVFVSKVGTSISTITDAPRSLIDEAAKDAAELSSSQLAAAISSAEADALAHSTVAFLASTEASAPSSPTQPEPAQHTNSSSASTLIKPLAANPSTDTLLPIGLELRSNAGTTTTGQQQATTTEVPATVVAVIYGSSTSIMTSVPPTFLAGIASSQVLATSVSSMSQQPASSEDPLRPTQTSDTFVPVDTNGAQVKSTQTALIQTFSDSDETTATSSAASSSTTTDGFSTSISQVASSSSASATSNKVYTIPVTMTSAISTFSADNTLVPWAAKTPDSAPSLTVYGSQSTSSTAADIAADNAAGASGGDSGSFQLSKGAFAAIISVVSIGVGLGIIFLVLFVIARRRQWKVRQSIIRASRRITGRFSSHPNKTALRSEKEPTLPIIEPRQPMGPRPAPSSRRQQGFANIDATLHTNYRGVETVGRSASRGPEAWRKAMAKERLQQSQSQRKKPELRVDTGVASRIEEGRGVQGGAKKRGDWKDLFRAL
ncbi:hypothetical protein KCU78_g1744, partial [Aureobasidium melanogenum]